MIRYLKMIAGSREDHVTPESESPGRPMFVIPSFVRVAMAGLMVCLTGPASAAVYINLVENGAGDGIISVTLSGALDFSAGVSASSAGYSNGIGPANGTIGFGPTAGSILSWSATGSTPTMVVQSATPAAASGAIFAPYGPGGFMDSAMTNFSGDRLFLFQDGIRVDGTYASGSSLSASATLLGTFQSLGITAGTATTEFTLDGIANTLTVTATAIPEPSSLLFVLLGGGLGLLRRRR